MVRYLLDTNIVSFLIRQQYPTLNHRMSLLSTAELAVSAVTEAELRYGAARMPSAARLPPAIENFLENITVLPWDSSAARRYASLRSELELRGEPLATLDTMIAAHALASDLTLVTNDKDFQRVKQLKMEDWTQGPHPA